MLPVQRSCGRRIAVALKVYATVTQLMLQHNFLGLLLCYNIPTTNYDDILGKGKQPSLSTYLIQLNCAMLVYNKVLLPILEGKKNAVRVMGMM